MKTKTKSKYTAKDGYTKEEREEYEFIDEARERIETAIETDGPYSHNIVGMCLSRVAGKFGNAAANNLVKDSK